MKSPLRLTCVRCAANALRRASRTPATFWATTISPTGAIVGIVCAGANPVSENPDWRGSKDALATSAGISTKSDRPGRQVAFSTAATVASWTRTWSGWP